MLHVMRSEASRHEPIHSPTIYCGPYCITDVDDCAQSPCEHGRCTDLGENDYECACDEGWTGENCDEGKRTSLVYHPGKYNLDPTVCMNMLQYVEVHTSCFFCIETC